MQEVARSQTGLSDWTTLKETHKRKNQYFSLDVVKLWVMPDSAAALLQSQGGTFQH